MKKIILYTLALLIGTTLNSCVSEVDDIFPDTSANRIQETLKKDREVLLSATNGWVMEYFGSPTSNSYGGYNLIMKFNADSTVTVASEKALNPYKTETSHFKLEQSAGDILSFDGYNELIHYFSDPSALEDGWTAGYGFEGDLEFRILKAASDSIILTGKKHGARVVMTPLPAEYAGDWEGYLNKIKAIEEEMIFSSFKLIANGDTSEVSLKNKSLIFSYIEIDEETDSIIEQVKQICYIITPQGLKMYKNLEFNGVTISGFKFEENADNYSSFEDANVILAPNLPCLVDQLLNKNNVWWITRDNLSDPVKAQWDIAETGLNKIDETFRYVNLQTKNNKFGLYARNYNTKKKSNIGEKDAAFIYLDPTKLGDSKIQLVFQDVRKKNTDCDTGGAYYLNTKNVKNFDKAVYTLGVKTGKTFTLTTDRLKKPSYILLTDDADPNNTIKVKLAYEDYQKIDENQ